MIAQVKRILIVDDNPKDVELTISALAEKNLANEVVVAEDGVEALEYLNKCGKFENEKYYPAVILLDIKMPSDCNDGYSLIFYELGEQPNKFGQKAGNLVIKFNIVNDTCFQRVNKHDFLFLQTISLQESFVGKDIAIPHMDGDININIKQFGIINPNKEYIIENKGLCNKGNLRIKFIIQYPDNKVFTDNQISCISDIFKTLDIQ